MLRLVCSSVILGLGSGWLVAVAGAPLGDGANAHECLTACLPGVAALVGAVEALEVVALGAGFASHHSPSLPFHCLRHHLFHVRFSRPVWQAGQLGSGQRLPHQWRDSRTHSPW